MIKTIENNFGLVLLVFGILGFLVPQFFLPIKDFGDELMMFALFLGFLKLDFSEVTHLKENKLKMGMLILSYLVILPLAFFALSNGINEDLRLGVFILLAISSAMLCPLLAGLLRLKVLWVTVFVVFTSFLVPFTAPLLLKWCFGVTAEISMSMMILFLSKMVFIPALSAYFCRKWIPSIAENLKKQSGILGVVCMSVFLAILIAGNQVALEQSLFSPFAFQALVGLFILFFVLYFIGYFLPTKNTKERLTNSLMFGNMNNGLSILLVAEFFNPEVLLVVLLSEIPWVLA